MCFFNPTKHSKKDYVPQNKPLSKQNEAERVMIVFQNIYSKYNSYLSFHFCLFFVLYCVFLALKDMLFSF